MMATVESQYWSFPMTCSPNRRVSRRSPSFASARVSPNGVFLRVENRAGKLSYGVSPKGGEVLRGPLSFLFMK